MAVEILDFPVEILEIVFFEAILPWPNDVDKLTDYDTGISIALTCKTFNLVVQKVMYRRIELGNPELDPISDRAENLTQALTLYPALQPTCQSFQVYLGMGAFDEKTFKSISKLVTLLHRLRVFEVCGSTGHPWSWLLLLKAIQTETVEEIRVGDCIIPPRGVYKLQRRQVWGVSMATLGENIHGNVADFLETQNENGTQPVIKTAKFNAFSQTPRLLHEILTWFTGLEHFEFTYNRPYAWSYRWNYANIGAAIKRHKETLKSILIHQFGYSWVGLFDLTSYTSLKVIELSFYNVTLEPPQSAATCLLAPNLELLVFDFWTIIREKAKYNCIAKRDHEWLTKFGECASKVRKDLPRVHAKIPVYTFRGTEKELWDARVTFESLDDIEDEMQGYGIDFTYDDPPVSKEEFRDWIREKDEWDVIDGLWRQMNRYAAYLSDESDSGVDSGAVDSKEQTQESTDKVEAGEEETQEPTGNLNTQEG